MSGMASDAEQKARCPVCGQVIADLSDAHRCPACGSYDVAILRTGDIEHDATGKSSSSSDDIDEEPVVISKVHPIRLLLPKPPKGVPRACWEQLRTRRCLILTFSLIPLALWLVQLLLPGNSWWAKSFDNLSPYIWVLVLIVCSIAAPRAMRQAIQRFEAEVRSSHLQNCLQCGYSLKGLPDKHRCPECGEPYNIAVVKRTWERYFEAQQRKR